MKLTKLSRKKSLPPLGLTAKETRRRAQQQIRDLNKYLAEHPELAGASAAEFHLPGWGGRRKTPIEKKETRGDNPAMPSKRLGQETHIEKVGVTSREAAFAKFECGQCDAVFIFEGERGDSDGAAAPKFCPMCGRKNGA